MNEKEFLSYFEHIKKDIKYLDYTEVLKAHEALQKANESINKLGLVSVSL